MTENQSLAEPLLDAHQAARLLHVPRSTLTSWSGRAACRT